MNFGIVITSLFWSAGDPGSFLQCASKSSFQTWRQSIHVFKNHTLLRSVDARSGVCGRRSCGRKLGAIQFLSPRITRSCVPLMPAVVVLQYHSRILVNCTFCRYIRARSRRAAAAAAAGSRSGGCGRRSGGRAPLLRRLPVLRPMQRVRPRRRVQPPLRRLRAARAALEPRVMIDLQCNVHTAIRVQYRVGSPGWIRQKKTDMEEHEIRYRSTKASSSILYTDIEGAFVDIEKSSISVYNDIEVLNFDIDVSLISHCVDIEVTGSDIEDSSISYWFDIECYILRSRCFSEPELRHSSSSSISTWNVKIIDIELS
jgi:hypothetical protein